jgi:hypothetical protein
MYDQWQNSKDPRLLNTLDLTVRFPDEPGLADLYVAIKGQDYQLGPIKQKIKRYLTQL